MQMYQLKVLEFRRRLDQLVDAYNNRSLVYLSKEIQCSKEFLEIFPTHPVLREHVGGLLHMQCDNRHLSIDYVLEHNNQIEWSWSLLSCNPSIATPENLDKYPKLPWCFRGISIHIPFDYYLKHPHKYWWAPNLVCNSGIPLEYLVENVLSQQPFYVSFYHRTEWVPNMFDRYREDPQKWYFVPNCFSYLETCSLEEVRANMDLGLPVGMLSGRAYLTKEFVIQQIHKPWFIDTMRKEILDRELADAFLQVGKTNEYLLIMANLIEIDELDQFVLKWSREMNNKVWLLLSTSNNLKFSDIIARKDLCWCWYAVARRRDACMDQISPVFMHEYETHRLLYQIQDACWHDAIRLATRSKQYMDCYSYFELDRKLLDFTEWHARMHMAAYKIQKWWIKRYYDPAHPICTKRLLREFVSLKNGARHG